MLAEVDQAIEVELGIRLRQNQARQHEHNQADEGIAHGHALAPGTSREECGKFAARNLYSVEQGDHDEDEREAAQGQLRGSDAEQQMVVADRHADKARRGEGNRLRDQKAKPQAYHQRKHADDQRFRQDYRGNLSRAHAEQKVGAELLLAGSNHEPVGV